MRNFSKIILFVLAISISSPLYCTDSITQVNLESKRQEPEINQKRLLIYKLRIYWHAFTYGFGIALTAGGIALIPISLAGAGGLIKPLNKYKSSCLLATASSPLLIYLSLKLVQKSKENLVWVYFDAIKDSIIEYFDFGEPSFFKKTLGPIFKKQPLKKEI